VKNQDNQAYLHQANDVLKRCVLHTSRTATLATQTGKAWVEQLNKQGKKPLSEEAQNVDMALLISVASGSLSRQIFNA